MSKQIRFLFLLGLITFLSMSVVFSEDALVIEINVAPETLILGADQGGEVSVHTNLSFSKVNTSTISFEGLSPTWVKADARGELVAYFSEIAVKNIVFPPEATLTLEGYTKDGIYFSGSDTVRVIWAGKVSYYTGSSEIFTKKRVVFFVAEDELGEILKTWDENIIFTNDPSTKTASAYYDLEALCKGIATISAKTNWHLRQKKLPVIEENHLVVDFELLGGDIDIDHDNMVNVSDYNLLKSKWFSHDSAADINGDGTVNVIDYNILKANWFKTGD